MEVKLEVNGNEIVLQKFVQKIWRGIVIGLVKELKEIPDDVREIKLLVKP